MSLSRVQLTEGWTFKQQEWSQEEWLPVAKVPSQIHMDLLANKKIPDPFVDLNERAVQWVGEKNWLYRVNFNIPEVTVSHTARKTATDLVFEGLDTFASVSLNGTQILQTDNMFAGYRVDVSHLVRTDAENTLDIVFDSAILRGRELVQQHSHEHNFLVRQTEAGRVPSRKAQYNWGWDWGPILMTAGPWKPVYVEQYEARIDDVWAQNEVSSNLQTVSGSIFANVVGADPFMDKVMVSLLSPDGKTVFETESRISDGGAVEVPFTLRQPDLWYPLTYGKQSRYTLKAEILRSSSGAALDTISKFVGFRRTELVQEPDGFGKSFYFRINNVDVFCAGSCWIPADSNLADISEQRYRDWVRLAADGNQVMLRVWGGGVYEHDALLDACDELGVLVWHDFQFACASYPAYPSYLASVELEARQQVRRLRWHPSVVLWAGNNEDYQVQERYKLDYDFANKDPESWLQSSFPARYIYEHLLPNIVKEEDPFMLYHPSSPWGDGKPTADPTVGDIHQWNIWHGAMNKYQEAASLGGRFVSEFGMEAYPHLSTIARMVSDPSQRRPGSIPMDFHNKGIGHERRLAAYVIENFRPRFDDLAAHTHLTQVVQADAMRFAYKFWRRDWGRPGARRCGGVLVWQLNDCWPTFSWAVVDYYLVPKPAYYAIARASRQLDVGVSRTYHDWTQTGYYVDENSGLYTGQVDQTLPARNGSSFDVWIASNSVRPIAVSITVRFISVRSGKDVAPSIQKTISADPNATTDAFSKEPLRASIPHADDTSVPFDVSQYDPYVVHATLVADGAVVTADTAWPDPVKFLDMADRGVSFDVSSAGDQVVVSAQRPVKAFVFEEVPGLRLSDNGFDIMPGEKQVVKVQGALKAAELKWTFVDAPGSSLPVA